MEGVGSLRGQQLDRHGRGEVQTQEKVKCLTPLERSVPARVRNLFLSHIDLSRDFRVTHTSNLKAKIKGQSLAKSEKRSIKSLKVR